MAKYERTEEQEMKMWMDAIGGNVELNMLVEIVSVGGKLKAYAKKVNCYLQFPRALRRRGARFLVDAAEAQDVECRKFYRTYKGTIRDMNGEVVG